jgi:hypothetical protein
MNNHLTFEFVAKLFDDESTRKKLEVMEKWNAIIDDERNGCPDMSEAVEQLLQLGKTYRFAFSIEEIDEEQNNLDEDWRDYYSRHKINKNLDHYYKHGI